MFASQNKLALLIDIGVKIQSSNEELEFYIKNIEIYNEDNSYKITKLLFYEWRKTRPSERKKYTKILLNKKLHTNKKGFLNPLCVILGKTFCANKNFDEFSDWFLNEKYFNFFFEEDLKELENEKGSNEINSIKNIKIKSFSKIIQNNFNFNKDMLKKNNDFMNEDKIERNKNDFILNVIQNDEKVKDNIDRDIK